MLWADLSNSTDFIHVFPFRSVLHSATMYRSSTQSPLANVLFEQMCARSAFALPDTDWSIPLLWNSSLLLSSAATGQSQKWKARASNLIITHTPALFVNYVILLFCRWPVSRRLELTKVFEAEDVEATRFPVGPDSPASLIQLASIWSPVKQRRRCQMYRPSASDSLDTGAFHSLQFRQFAH